MDGQRRFNYVSKCFGEHEAGRLVECFDENEIRVGIWFAYQGMSRIQGSKKVRNKEFGMRDLFSTQEVRITQV
ncbi:hypothetical protein ACE6H2_014776 [Prunus campanulata]